MPIFKLSAPKTMRLLIDHILPRNASNFTCSHLDLKNSPWDKPRTPAYRVGKRKGREWKELKGSYLKKGRKGKERRAARGRGNRGREGPVAGDLILLQGLSG